MINIFQWEGQSLVLVYFPLVATIVTGVSILIWRSRTKRTPRRVMSWLGSLSGMFFIGTGTMTFYQMVFSLIRTSIVPEAAVTMIFILIPILMGIATIRFAWKDEISLKYRTYIAVLGIAALFAWAGLFIGPALAIVTSITPFA